MKYTIKTLINPIQFTIYKKFYSLSGKQIKLDCPTLIICLVNSILDIKLANCAIKNNLVQIIPKSFNPCKQRINIIKSNIAIDPVEPDIIAVRKITRNIEAHKNVILYVNRTEFENMLNKILKLIKICRVKTIFMQLLGTDFAKPFWQKSKNKCNIDWEIFDTIEPDTIKKTSISQLTKRIKNINITKKITENKFTLCGRNPAENVEKTLYLCPECCSISTIRSKNNIFWCSACGENYTIIPNGKIHGEHFKSIAEWQKWQNEFLDEIIKRRVKCDEVIFHDYGWKVYDISNNKYHCIPGYFESFLFSNELLVANKHNRIKVELKNLVNCSLDYKNKIYVFAKDNTKFILVPTLNTNSIKYVEAMRKLKANNN